MKHYSVLIFLVLFSCQTQTPNKINLELIDNSFKVKSFYQRKINSTNKILDLEGKDQFEIDTLNYYPSNSLDENDLEISPKNGFWTSKQEFVKRFGYEYSTDIVSPKDSLAYFKNIVFPSINMIENKNGDFVSLVAKKGYYNEFELAKKELNILKNELSKINGKPIENRKRNQSSYSWTTNNSSIHIILIKKSESDNDSKLLFFNISKQYTEDIKLITEGEWTYLQ